MLKRNILLIVGFIVIIVLIVVIIILSQQKIVICDQSQAQTSAENWVKNSSPTYKFDGSGLKLQSAKTLECINCYQFIFEFKSEQAGYGDRSGQVLAQVITPHIMVVNTQNCTIVKAMTDGQYDEINRGQVDEGKMTIKVFFGNSQKDPQTNDCNVVYSVDRLIDKTVETAKASLEQLLLGPTDTEKEEGYLTSINTGVKINSIKIENSVAKVDFDEKLEEQVGGSCRIAAIRAQITQTLKQFSTIEDVLISINGRTEDILQP